MVYETLKDCHKIMVSHRFVVEGNNVQSAKCMQEIDQIKCNPLMSKLETTFYKV